MGEDVLLENLLTVRGLRRVHVMRLGEKIDRAAWIERCVPVEAIEYLSVFERYDVDVHMWHLHLVWNAREMVIHDQAEVVLWWPGRAMSGEGVASAREAIDLASWLYKIRKGALPETAWMRRLPRGATERVEVASLGASLMLVEANWVPEKYIAVG